MPGFHEHVEGLDQVEPEDNDVVIEEQINLHSEEPQDQAVKADPSSQTCPICGRVLDETDNTAVNAHIDFCLSKGAIKMATAASATSSKTSESPSKSHKTRKKPPSNTTSAWTQRKGEGGKEG